MCARDYAVEEYSFAMTRPELCESCCISLLVLIFQFLTVKVKMTQFVHILFILQITNTFHVLEMLKLLFDGPFNRIRSFEDAGLKISLHTSINAVFFNLGLQNSVLQNQFFLSNSYFDNLL